VVYFLKIEMMKKIFLLLSVLFPFSIVAIHAQDVIVPDGYEIVDSVIFRPAASVDSSLIGKSIFSVMPSGTEGKEATVHIYQSQSIVDALNDYALKNSSKPISGYRVRIFFDNRQSARSLSASVLSSFVSSHPGIAAYRSYSNPYFKVSAGDFRNKSGALQLLAKVKSEFPKAFIVKENIKYPVVDSSKPFVTDTLKVVRPVKQ
jgi:hypothetical protein